MKSAQSVLEKVEKALGTLETALEKNIRKGRQEPQLELARNEREVNKKIAAKLDQTIHRLEAILTEE